MERYSKPSASSSAENRKAAKLRKYDGSYIEFGFIQSSDGRPECVLCLLVNEAMKPAKLKHHLTTKHPEFKNKNKDIFFGEKVMTTYNKTNGELGHNFTESTVGFLFSGSVHFNK